MVQVLDEFSMLHSVMRLCFWVAIIFCHTTITICSLTFEFLFLLFPIKVKLLVVPSFISITCLNWLTLSFSFGFGLRDWIWLFKPSISR